MDAIVLRGVGKQFKKNTIRREYTTFKSELIRILRRQKRKDPPPESIVALRDINLTVEKGQTFGLVGRNGSGKSTLLKLITGIYAPTEGTVEVNGRISALLELGAGFHPDFSGRENIMINGVILGMSRSEIRDRMDEIIAFAELGDFIDEPVRTYSSGMYMRLAFAVATHVDPEVLIIDEILAVGDEHFAKKSRAKLMEFKEQGKTIFLVTHDLGSLQQWCDRAAWLDKGRLVAVGEPHEIVAEYRRAIRDGEAAAEAAAAQRQAGEVPRPRFGPAPQPSRRWGSFSAEIASVELLDPAGAERSVVTPEDPLRVGLVVDSARHAGPLKLVLSLVRADGLPLWSTRAPEFSLTPGTSTRLEVHLARLGIGAGDYWLNVALHDAGGGCLDAQQEIHRLSVRAEDPDSNLLQFAHSWAAPQQIAPPLPGGPRAIAEAS